MEDSDPAEEVRSGKVCKAWKPYGPDLGIEALDKLFVLADDSTAASMDGDEGSGESEEDEGSGSGSGSVGDEEIGAAVVVGDVEMEEVVNTVEAANA